MNDGPQKAIPNPTLVTNNYTQEEVEGRVRRVIRDERHTRMIWCWVFCVAGFFLGSGMMAVIR